MLSQFATASKKRNVSKPPHAFTEHGAVMAANVLNSKRAVAMSVEVVRAFVQLRRVASSHEKIARILADLEAAVTKRLDKHDREIEALFGMMEALIGPEDDDGPKRVGSA